MERESRLSSAAFTSMGLTIGPEEKQREKKSAKDTLISVFVDSQYVFERGLKHTLGDTNDSNTL